jgi:methylthioribose-1-phosphate isomerase
MDKKRRENEAYKKLADSRATAYDIKQSLKKIQPKIDANEQVINLARQQSPHRPVCGMLQPESNTVAEALARIETLKARGREFKEALDVAEENVRVAEAEVKQFCE